MTREKKKSTDCHAGKPSLCRRYDNVTYTPSRLSRYSKRLAAIVFDDVVESGRNISLALSRTLCFKISYFRFNDTGDYNKLRRKF
jgi:hypothetical protein